MDSKTVLIVDDEADIRDSLHDALSDEGYQVLVASNGKEALDLLPTIERPCAIVLDIIMPVMSGTDFYRHIKAIPRWADIPVLISSSDPSRAPTGAAVMRKPIDLERFLLAVDGLFQRHPAAPPL